MIVTSIGKTSSLVATINTHVATTSMDPSAVTMVFVGCGIKAGLYGLHAHHNLIHHDLNLLFGSHLQYVVEGLRRLGVDQPEEEVTIVYLHFKKSNSKSLK